jgi:ribosomal protein S18 acetylase RimI-like enzyme
MIETEIVKYENSMLPAIEEIFFLSTSIKTFASEEKKLAFFKRWCGDYIAYYPEQFFILRNLNTKKILGYLSGCNDSKASLLKLEVPGHKIFEDLFGLYPAHLHINFHPDCRGQGLGSLLVDYYINVLVKNKISGVHLITSPDAHNISFYRRLKFADEFCQESGKMQLLFMGRKLC